MRASLFVLILLAVYSQSAASGEDIFHAAESGNVEKIQLLIKGGANVDVVKSGDTPLSVAVRHNKLGAVKVLLASGANPNVDYQGITPLQTAVIVDTEIVRTLINSGADVNRASDKYKYSPLGHMARLCRLSDFQRYQREGSYSGPIPDCVETAKILIQAGADVNHVDAFSKSPLRSAIEVNNVEIVEVLLDAKADVHRRIDYDHGSDSEGDTVLMAAITSYCVHKDLSIIKLLLDHGANPNDRNELPYDAHVESNGIIWRGYSVLTFAAKEGLTPVVKLLLEYGADPELPRTDGETAAHLAKKHKHSDVAHVLKVGQKVNSVGR